MPSARVAASSRVISASSGASVRAWASAVDPATEVRLQRTLDAVTRGRTTVAIAHRLSTAEGADEVIVFDRGRMVQRGPHADLVAVEDSVYARLHAAWLEQTGPTDQDQLARTN